jgi:hypothetical protein
MFLKLTDNFYQLTDVFSPELYQKLVYTFNQDRSMWSQITDDNTDVKRQQLSLSVNEYLGQQINKELRKYVRTVEPRVGQLYQNGPQLWYDSEGYINTIHDGDVSPNHCVNVQVYLSDGAENMGTCCYDAGAWHTVPYRANCGYMLVGPTRIPHGMQHPVTDYRISLYQGFRNTEVPSDIW